MSEQLIKTRSIGKVFNGKGKAFTALSEIDLEVNRGEFVALEGPSGSGKSTLLSILGLLDKQSEGHYELAGHAVHELSNYQRTVVRNRHVGWIFQNFNLINDMTVLENVMLPLRYHPSIAASDYRQRATKALEQVSIEDKWESFPSQLSGGQQQRVAIARALVTDPDLILADEPTGNLDSETAEQILQVLEHLHQQGATLLMVTHDASIAARSQRRLQLQDGNWKGA